MKFIKIQLKKSKLFTLIYVFVCFCHWTKYINFSWLNFVLYLERNRVLSIGLWFTRGVNLIRMLSRLSDVIILLVHIKNRTVTEESILLYVLDYIPMHGSFFVFFSELLMHDHIIPKINMVRNRSKCWWK
jgi:hypothetical protein